jgi:hypothetical protein
VNSEYLTECNNILFGGVQKVYRFPNEYGASVIKHDHSYGGADGLWELAVLDKAGELCYDTPITSDVLGWLTWEEVEENLTKIKNL